jgi:hypothetical protein
MIGRGASLIALCLLAACSVAPAVRATRAGAQGVTYEFPLGRRAEATREASLYCANLGRAAVLKHIEIGADDRATAAYECR